MQPGTGAYSIPVAIRLEGSLDRDRLKTCFDIAVQRHESLRTVFEVRDGEPFQVVASQTTADFSFHEPGNDEAARDAAIGRFARQPFNLSQGPLFRVGLFSVSPDEHVLVMVIHHIIADYSSLQILIDEVYRLYSAADAPAIGQLRHSISSTAIMPNGSATAPRHFQARSTTGANSFVTHRCCFNSRSISPGR